MRPNEPRLNSGEVELLENPRIIAQLVGRWGRIQRGVPG